MMRLNEFDISPAVSFHTELNPALWNGRNLLPDVRLKLIKIAADFKDFIGVDNYDLMDVTISGSNAAYTYTPNSDIDLHLVVIIPHEHDPELRQLFDAKKYQYNDQFDFTIRGYDVELYVQDAHQAHSSMGIYSIKNDRWISEPKPVRATVDDSSVEHRYRTYKARLHKALSSPDAVLAQRLWDNIKNMRKAGLAHGGEFSPENLVFKLLRAEGDLGDLRDHLLALKSKQFSLEARNG